MAQRWTLDDEFKLNRFVDFVSHRIANRESVTVEFVEKGRTLSQNALINWMYRQVASQKDDMTFEDIKNHCKLHLGIGIMKSHDPDWADWYDAHIKGWEYEDKLIFVSNLEMTSHFDKEQASEYIDTLIDYWAKQGIFVKTEM